MLGAENAGALAGAVDNCAGILGVLASEGVGLGGQRLEVVQGLRIQKPSTASTWPPGPVS